MQVSNRSSVRTLVGVNISLQVLIINMVYLCPLRFSNNNNNNNNKNV